MNWHRLFGFVLTDFVTDTPFASNWKRIVVEEAASRRDHLRRIREEPSGGPSREGAPLPAHDSSRVRGQRDRTAPPGYGYTGTITSGVSPIRTRASHEIESGGYWRKIRRQDYSNPLGPILDRTRPPM